MPAPMHADILDDLLEPAYALAQEFQDLTWEFDDYMGTKWKSKLIGPDPDATGKQNRTQRAASLDNQLGTHLSKNGLPMLIPDDQPKGSMYTPQEHVLRAKQLAHPYQSPPHLPMDLKFASKASVEDVSATRERRQSKAHRLEQLASKSDILDRMIWSRMSTSVKVVAGKARLGLLTVLMFVLRWPDWQLTSLYTRGFKVSGLVDPSNIYPKTKCKGEGTLHDLLESEEADAWNIKLESDTKAFDHDKDVWDTSQDQKKTSSTLRCHD